MLKCDSECVTLDQNIGWWTEWPSRPSTTFHAHNHNSGICLTSDNLGHNPIRQSKQAIVDNLSDNTNHTQNCIQNIDWVLFRKNQIRVWQAEYDIFFYFVQSSFYEIETSKSIRFALLVPLIASIVSSQISIYSKNPPISNIGKS